MPLIVHLSLVVASALLLFLCSTTSCLGSQYRNRSEDSCGKFHFGYPFGRNGSGCGDPEFQLLDCDDHSGHPMLNISGQKYRILDLLMPGSSMTIVSDNLFGSKCNLSGNYSQLWSPGSHFSISADAYTNLTLSRQCHKSDQEFSELKPLPLCGEDWYYNIRRPEDGTHFCQTHQQIPIKRKYLYLEFTFNQDLLKEGFQITWRVDEDRNQSCDACWESGGRCGYNISAQFVCYCPDGTTYPARCLPNPHGRINRSAVVIGLSLGAGGLLVGITLYAKRRRKAASRCSVSKVEEFLKEYADQMPTRYSLSQIKKITNNFAEKLGEGGFGVVYKGKLRNGTLVAVKLMDRHRQGESTDFINEVATIGRLHHVNLVRLLGYCFESFTSALVYEFMANGSLEKFIFAGKEKGRLLTWEKLYSIALGAARGIAYLHQDCEKRIIHFDIKPHNILLDADFTPKVSDFGLAKLCRKGDDHISMTATRGTPGYVAPEVFDRALGPATDKSDVYSFGMLLLEIVGERKNFDSKVSHSSQFYFPEWAFKLLERGELGMRLRGGEVEAEDEEKARRMTKVGLWCIQYNYNDRPSMSSVVQMLQENGGEVANPPLPSNPHSASPENPLLSSAEESSSIEIRS
eukprot:PITA_19603